MSGGPDKKILAYLREQNRPYSATDIFTNLHKAIGKTQVSKSLESLSKCGDLVEKCYGKQKIYFVNQASLPGLGEGELRELESRLQGRSEAVSGLRETTRGLESELAGLAGSLTTQQAQERVGELDRRLEKGKEKLASLKETCKNIAPSDKIQINQEHEKLTKEWKRRKRMCMDVINAVMENDGCTQSKKELLEEIGIDTDEDSGAIMPSTGA